MSPEIPEDPSKKIMRIPERKLTRIHEYFYYREHPENFYGRRVLITQKGKVVAHAGWDESHKKLTVEKIRRPQKTALKIGQILMDNTEYAAPIPREYPELKTEGVFLFRTHAYDSSHAVRPDPFWNEYEGWALIPKVINEQDGLKTFLDEYPEIAVQSYLKLDPTEQDSSGWMMADQRAVDAYVCGRSDQPPQLIPFELPAQADIVSYRPVMGPTGHFEFFSLYFENRWIVYVPRNAKTSLEDGG